MINGAALMMNLSLMIDFAEISIEGVTYYVSNDKHPFYDVRKALKRSPIKLITLPEWKDLPAHVVKEFGVSGPIWTGTKISCPIQAVWVADQDGSGHVDRYDKTFSAWAVAI